ncbi:unnamed protein product [Adineta ricciae]|uniref:Mitochondrial cytochrome c oxidase subunit VIc/VIIs domain-containing protein n=1 Tax=Adineta ricciae TaxID=249248 RepID=A0A814JAI6_ADIRI|nr:unnamed protein product [Adineta ricciae]
MSSKTDAVSTAKSGGTKAPSSTASGRPVLKNLTRARVPRAGLIGVSMAIVGAVTWKVLVSDRHKDHFTSFYKSFDPERDYARMKASGVFKSLEGVERPAWLSEYEGELDAAIASLRELLSLDQPKRTTAVNGNLFHCVPDSSSLQQT